MAILIADRVQETSTSPGGTGTLTLTGSPVVGYKSFANGIGTGNSFYYTIYDAVTYAWEVGIGSWTANVLTRTTVLSNSLNTTAFISFANGNTLNVWVDYPASSGVAQTDVGTSPNQIPLNQYLGSMAYEDKSGVESTGTLGYALNQGAGGAVTQITSRTTGVTLNKATGQITMFSAAGSATAATFTVTNSQVAATDTIIVNQSSGTNLYVLLVTAVTAGTFNITFYTTGGTATDAPVLNFSVIKGSAA
jgi:hypothetical protein